MPLAYSIADGIAFGFIAYPVVKLVSGRAKEVHWLVYLLAVVALIHFFYPV
jgi:AGZA family xanthine/uracil permease-like MFS transporter